MWRYTYSHGFHKMRPFERLQSTYVSKVLVFILWWVWRHIFPKALTRSRKLESGMLTFEMKVWVFAPKINKKLCMYYFDHFGVKIQIFDKLLKRYKRYQNTIFVLTYNKKRAWIEFINSLDSLYADLWYMMMSSSIVMLFIMEKEMTNAL